MSRLVIATTNEDLTSFLSGVKGLEAAWEAFGWDWEIVIEGFVVAVEGGLKLGDLETVERWLRRFDSTNASELTNYLRAQRERLEGLVAVSRGDGPRAHRSFKKAAGASER